MDQTTALLVVDMQMEMANATAANLGFDVLVPEDALIAFALPSRHGGDIEAEVALEVTLSALHAGFGKVVPTSTVLKKITVPA